MDRATQAKLNAAVNGRHALDLSKHVTGDEVAVLLNHKIVLDENGDLKVYGEPSFDAALDKLMATRPHWQAVPVDTDLEAEVLRTGSLKSHGDLYKQLGETEYKSFCARTGAKPGKPATMNGDNVPTPSASNPFSKIGFSLRKQGELLNAFTKAHGKEKAMEKLEAIAAAAGVKVGATRGIY
ncbi:MAG: hypothetical protein ABSA68_02605 [Xanthobacteraceae bacterium]|jgi:hypothetical protein